LCLERKLIIFLLVELDVEWHQVHCSLKPVDGTVDLDVSVVALVVYVLNQQPNLFVDIAVIAGKWINLMELAESLGKVTASLLHQLLPLVILLAS
jgi:hypothetical protein